LTVLANGALAMRRLLALALAGLMVAAATVSPAWAQTFPQLTGRVVDDAHLLQPAEISALDAKLAALETQSQRQVVVVTVPSLGGDDIDDYGYKLGRAWGIGNKQRNDGLLLIIAPNEHKMRIEVGYGLEGIVTDAISFMIIRHDLTPRFKAGDYAGGINAAVDALITQLRLPDDQARAVAAQAKTQMANERQPHFDAGTVVFLVIFLLFFVLPFMRMLGGGGRRYGGGVWIMPMGGFGGGWGGGGGGGGGSGWGGGGGGGGGFSGGGGGFGGGGASGGW
jgi:uncharacterized protein